jgi:hypothetical protein
VQIKASPAKIKVPTPNSEEPISHALRFRVKKSHALIFAPFGTDNDFNRPSGTGSLCTDTQALRAWLLSGSPSGTKTIRDLRIDWHFASAFLMQNRILPVDTTCEVPIHFPLTLQRPRFK